MSTTNVSNFDIKNDLKVYLYSYDPDLFIIGYSLLGGPKELGTSDLDREEINCEVYAASFTNGVDVLDSTLFQPTANQMSLSLRVANSDPFINANFTIGRQIELAVDETSLIRSVWLGYISDFTFEYVPDEPVLMNLTAHDALYYLNQHYIDKPNPDDELFSPFAFIDEQFEYIVSDFIAPQTEDPPVIDLISMGQDVLFLNYSEDFSLYTGFAGDLMNNRAQAANAFFTYANNKITILSKTRIEFVLTQSPRFAFDTTASSHLCPTRLSFESNLQYINNDVFVELTQNPDSNYRAVDLELQRRYGITEIEGSFTFYSESSLSEWANYNLNAKALPQLRTIQIKPIDQVGDLKNTYTTLPGEVVSVFTDYNGIEIEKVYLVTRVTHTITPDTWIIDLELWNRN